MTAACVDPLPLYRPRDPQASDLWRLLDQHFETFQQVYDERFAASPQQGLWSVVGKGTHAFAATRCEDHGEHLRMPFTIAPSPASGRGLG